MALVNIASWASYGLKAVWIAERASEGFMAGWDGLTPDDEGSFSAMRRLKGGITAPIAVPQKSTERTRGDGRTLANWKRDADQDNLYILDMALRDLEAEGFFAGGKTFNLGYYRVLGALGASSSRNKDTVLLLHRLAQSQEDSSLNAEGYENLLVYSNKIDPIGDDQFGQDEVGGSRYQGVANPVAVTPWGVSVQEANGFSSAIVESWVTEFPDMMQAVIGDGTMTEIPLSLEPADANVDRVVVVDFTASLAADALVTVPVSSVSVADKEVVVGSALTDKSVYLVQWQFAPELL